MKAKFLLAIALLLTLSIGSAFAGTTKTETYKTNGQAGQYHRHHHHHRMHHHHMMH